MAEYSAVIKEAKRMCWHYTQGGNHDKCPMYPACNVSQCRKIAFERPADFEERIMAWAAEHPEPVYPSWDEWLLSVGGGKEQTYEVHGYSGNTEVVDFETQVIALNEPIPAETAKRLGVKPKEGTEWEN